MKHTRSAIFVWTPRVLLILYVIIFSLFAMDAFSSDTSVFTQAGDFAMHLIPSYILLGLLWLSIKRARLSGVVLIIVTGGMMLFFKNNILVNLMLFGPLLAVAGMFIFSSPDRHESSKSRI